MKTIQKSLLMMVLVMIPALVLARDFATPSLGMYGINYHKDAKAYAEEFVGKVVKYLPEGENGSLRDMKYFVEVGGKFDAEYTIMKVSGDYKKMTFLLQENGTKNKVKFEFSNSPLFNSDRFDLSEYNKDMTLPLFLFKDFERDVNAYKGKEVENLVISDIFLYKEDKKYPTPTMIVTDKSDDKTYITFPKKLIDYLTIGDVYTNPKFKCTYTVVGVKYKYSTKYDSVDQHYVVKNSITKETKEIHFVGAKEKAFEGDGDGRFHATLQKVEAPTNSEVRYGETKEITDKDITKYSYIDNFIDIIIVAGYSQFDFIIKNVSDNTIKVVWNEAVFVDVDGSTSKVMHVGTKYSEREGDQPASTIIKGAKLEDIAAPTQNVYYSDILKKWTSYSLYKNADQKAEGQTIRLMLPIQVKDVINEYIFEFGLKYKLDHPELVVEE